ncbi:hypothetical protein [Pseudoxanthomonas sp.]|uniref:hypothetical protein n=1 Tax=Pseudoxanthomonas sp. TaxID=1871049 RepID=UPI0026296E55|nr:hypothetical protein [Pseudoxanthomonas sp.]WDS34762.1 MAG: hypothetical protein O8I58_10185 [Pseudoxanthomonas sp.]
MAIAMALLAGCHGPPQTPQPAGQSTTKEPSDMRTVIPLVRRLELTNTGPIELEFDVPALPEDDAPPVFVGVRVSGSDPTAAGDGADRLRAAGVSARVHIFRLDASGATPVTLMRSQMVSPIASESVALSPDGLAPALRDFDADFTTMQEAGLISEGSSYRNLGFAYTPELQAGRYRLVLDFVRHREALVEAKAELVVAYTAKGK